MNLTSLYSSFKSLVETDQIGLYSPHRNHSIFLEFRRTYGVHLKEEDESFLIHLLDDQYWKPFVPQVLNVLDSFSTHLCHKMINAAVHTKDPSFNRVFIIPCVRVFDVFLINQLLLDIVQHGDQAEQLGALQAFYWIHPRIMSIASGRNFEKSEVIGFHHHWNEKWKAYHFDHRSGENRMTKDEQQEYQKLVEQMKITRFALLMKKFITCTDQEILYKIGLALPRTIDTFPEDLKTEAKQYFELKTERQVPNNWKEFEVWRNRPSSA